MGLIISEGGVLSWFFYVICGFALGSARPDLDSLGSSSCADVFWCTAATVTAR